jgi:hypothetical protein
MAATNLVDGIDWYSVQERQFKSTTAYTVVGNSNYIVEVEFLDETTVIAGSNQSQLFVASYGMADHPHILEIPNAGGEPPFSSSCYAVLNWDKLFKQ